MRWTTPPPFYAFRDRLAADARDADLLWLEGMRIAVVLYG